MQNKVMQMYGGGKLFWEVEQKKEEMAANRLKRDFRRANRKPPKLVPGMKIGLLELVGRDWKQGYFGPLHRGRWLVKCSCGHKKCNANGEIKPNGKPKLLSVPYWRLIKGGAYSCGMVERPRKIQVSSRPPNKLQKRVYGRLTIDGDYEMNKGWPVRCKGCGQREWVRYSRLLERYGKRPCISNQGR